MVSTPAADRARLADIDAEISLLELSLSTLRKQRAEVQERLDSYKYPVWTLPNELTSEIFLHTLPVYPNFPPLSGLGSPTLLAQICHRWREIAVATSELWRAILLDEYSVTPFTQQLHLCQIWLARSRSYPLTIQFEAITNAYETHVLDVIIPHRARWESLDIVLSPPGLVAIAGLMPMLRHLDLNVPRASRVEDVVRFSRVPLLRSVTLSAGTILKVALPLGQLTSLTLTLVFRPEYVSILQQATNLVRCKLGIVHDGVFYRQQDIELSCLESLTLGGEETGCLDDFLVPALRTLELDESILGSDPIGRLSSFIAKSGCVLQEVCVTRRTLLSRRSYRDGFPSIPQLFFRDDLDSESDSGV
ncbi:hypothetical protein K438DRAFT_440815 [Mycena galopus ATCC 62051]|nr:hypothetical protein K438DRAFT_440815 [Mycena galopus ATCC 62051]